MSKIRLTPNASGTGTVTLTVPSTNTDRTISLPDTAGNVVTTGDTGTITASMLDGGQSGSAPAFAVRAWANLTYDQVISDSGNVSSVTDHGTGDFSINFTTAMPSVNYATVAMGRTDTISQYAKDKNETMVCLAKGRTDSTSAVRIAALSVYGSPHSYTDAWELRIIVVC